MQAFSQVYGYTAELIGLPPNSADSRTFFWLFIAITTLGATLLAAGVHFSTRCATASLQLSERCAIPRTWLVPLALNLLAISTWCSILYWLTNQASIMAPLLFVAPLLGLAYTYVACAVTRNSQAVVQASLSAGLAIITSQLTSLPPLGTQGNPQKTWLCFKVRARPATPGAVPRANENAHALLSDHVGRSLFQVGNMCSWVLLILAPVAVAMAVALTNIAMQQQTWASAGLEYKAGVWLVGVALWLIAGFGDLALLMSVALVITGIRRDSQYTILRRGCSPCLVANVASSAMGSIAVGTITTWFAWFLLIVVSPLKRLGCCRSTAHYAVLLDGNELSKREESGRGCCLTIHSKISATAIGATQYGVESYVLLALTGEDFATSTRLASRVALYRNQREHLKNIKVAMQLFLANLSVAWAMFLAAVSSAAFATQADQNSDDPARSLWVVYCLLLALLALIPFLQILQAAIMTPVMLLLCFPEECLGSGATGHGALLRPVMHAWTHLQSKDKVLDNMKLSDDLKQRFKSN